MEEFHMISNLEPIKEKIAIQDEIDWNSKIESGCIAFVFWLHQKTRKGISQFGKNINYYFT